MRMNLAPLVREIEARVAAAPVLNAPALRALRREYSKRLTALPAAHVVRLAGCQPTVTVTPPPSYRPGLQRSR